MKKINGFPRPLAVVSVLISFLLLTGLSSTLRAATQPAVPNETIRAALQPFIDRKELGGAVALVATPDKVLAFDTVGYCQLTNQVPMRLDNMFWIASMTKTFTGVCIAMLIDEGKLTLDDPVEKFIPEFKGQMVANPNDPEHPIKADHPITIREIMCHTSGIAEGKILKGPNRFLKDDAVQYGKAPLMFQPGSKAFYNNAGIDTAGRIVEILSGMSYWEFLKTRVLDPLEMKDATFWPTEEQASRLAICAMKNKETKALYDRHLNEKPWEGRAPQALAEQAGFGVGFTYKNHYAMPAGGLYCTTSDLLPFCRMLLNRGVYKGKRYISEKTFAQFSSPQRGEANRKGSNEDYGVGCYVQVISGPGLPSVGSIGHRGAIGTVFWMDFSRKLIFVLMQQCDQNPAVYSAFIKAGCQVAGAN